MNQNKFAQMVREFPFLNGILAEQNLLSADLISSIKVARGDHNLLEVKPITWFHGTGGFDEYVGYRFFWCVYRDNGVISLEQVFERVAPYEKGEYLPADQIGFQLLKLNHEVQFIVEVGEACWNWEESSNPNVVVYRMRGFNWRNFVDPHRLCTVSS